MHRRHLSLRCYDRWIAEWGDPGKKGSNGDAYCYGIYRDTHRAAAGFLREIAPNHPSASAGLRQAADNFQAEADVLQDAEALLWWKSPEGPDTARNERVAAILQEARDHYASGIEQIEKALAQIAPHASDERVTERAPPEYGFRYDPMEWIEVSDSVPAAQVRALLLTKPKEGDEAILRAEIDRILSDRQPDGSLGDDTTGKLIRLSRLGCSPDRPAVQAAVKHIMAGDERMRDGRIGAYGLYVAEWVDYHDGDLVARSARQLASHVMTMDFWRLCPWSGQIHTRGLWSGRKHADVTQAVERGLNVMVSDIEERKGGPPVLENRGRNPSGGMRPSAETRPGSPGTAKACGPSMAGGTASAKSVKRSPAGH